jgi:hypothetical protein
MELKNVDIECHIYYNDVGKSFEELLAEGIKKISLKTIRKQITSFNATSEKECHK